MKKPIFLLINLFDTAIKNIFSLNFNKKYSVLLLCLWFFNSLSGQSLSGFLQLEEIPDEELSSYHLQKKQYFNSQSYIKSWSFASLGDINDYVDTNGVLQLELPVFSEPLKFALKYAESEDNGDYLWAGNLITNYDPIADSLETDSLFGNIMIRKSANYVFGCLTLDDKFYEIIDLGDDLHALIELYAGYGDCGGSIGIDSISYMDTTIVERGEAGCPVRLLILLTDAAREEFPELRQRAELGYKVLNNIHLPASDIGKFELSFILAGIVDVPAIQWQETSDIDNDMASIPTDLDITALRAQFAADIVVVITDNDYADFDGKVAGFGDSPQDVGNAYAIVEYSAILPTVFSHEVGHLFGCRHQDSDNCHLNHDDSGLFHSHGYVISRGKNTIITSKKEYRTILATCYNYQRRIGVFSNPDVKHFNKPTGTAERNNNAKTLRDAACRVANYVNTELPFVIIEGPKYGCPDETAYVLGVITDVPEPYQYSWQTTTDGITWSAPTVVVGNGGFSVPMPSEPGKIIIIKLTAGNINGPMRTAYHTIESNNTTIICQRQNIQKEYYLHSGAFTISPNPSNHLIQVHHTGKCNAKIQIYDTFGRLIKDMDQQFDNNSITIDLRENHLPSGMYFVHIGTNDFIKSYPIILNY